MAKNPTCEMCDGPMVECWPNGVDRPGEWRCPAGHQGTNRPAAVKEIVWGGKRMREGRCDPGRTCLACDRLGKHLEPVDDNACPECAGEGYVCDDPQHSRHGIGCQIGADCIRVACRPCPTCAPKVPALRDPGYEASPNGRGKMSPQVAANVAANARGIHNTFRALSGRELLLLEALESEIDRRSAHG